MKINGGNKVNMHRLFLEVSKQTKTSDFFSPNISLYIFVVTSMSSAEKVRRNYGKGTCLLYSQEHDVKNSDENFVETPILSENSILHDKTYRWK